MELGFAGCLKKIMRRNAQEVAMTKPSIAGNSHEKNRVLSASTNSPNVTQVLQPVPTMSLRPGPSKPVPFAFGQTTMVPSPAWYGITDTGRVRERNEDNFAILELADRVLFVVADGMGGHDAGDVASRIATEAVCKIVEGDHSVLTDPLALVERAVQEANIEVLQEGVRRRSDIGTTLSVVLVVNNFAYIAHVGDSRVYWIENGSISQITNDHSLVAKLVASRTLTKAEARNHPKSNLLFRSIGTDENVKVDTVRIVLKKGGTLLLCTDGLWGEISDEDMHRICTSERDAVPVAAKLVRAANENGGKDNITAIVARVS